MEKQSRQDQGRLNIVKARITGINSGEAEDAEYEDVDALEGEAAELQGQIDKRDKRIAEIKEKWWVFIYPLDAGIILTFLCTTL